MSDRQQTSVDFSGFVASLAATAVATLQQVDESLKGGTKEEESSADPPPPTSEMLATARHLIDTLGMLEEKTDGNLTSDEQRLLQTVLGDLRISFVRLSDRVRAANRPS